MNSSPLNKSAGTSGRPVEEILASASETIIAVNREWRILYINPYGVRSRGKKLVEMLGVDLWSEWSGFLGTELERQCRRAMAERIPIKIEQQDRETWWELSGYPSDDGLAVYLRDITERKAAEQRIGESEVRFRALFETTRDGILIVNEEGRYVEVNASYCQMLKTSRAHLIGAHFSEFIPPDRLAEAAEAFGALKRGENTPVEFPLKAVDGSIVDLEWTSSNKYLPGLFFCTCRDTSARKQIEDSLRAKEAELRTLLEALPDVICRFSRELRFLYVSPAIRRLTGLPADHFLGKTHLEAGLPINLSARLRESLERIIRTGKGESIEFEYSGQKNATYKLLGIGVPELDEHGRVRTVLSIVRDITERKRVEEEIRESERRYRTLAESLPQLVWTALPNGQCDYLSSQWVAYTGMPETEQLGMKWLDKVMHPDDRERTRKAWMNAVSGIAPYDLEYRLRRHDGVYRWFQTRGTPVRGTSGAVVRWFGSCTDIDAQKQAAEERQELLARESAARAIAEQLNRIGPLLNSELDPQKLAQRVTDIATQVIGAQFGSLFHNVLDETGESYLLYTLSGVPRTAFSKFPMPRNTEVFGPTFRGEGIVRSDDITKDPKYGKNAPYHGMPPGHLPVKSYLAAPVVSRSGDVLGGLFFGHSLAGVFTAAHETLVGGIAGHAAIALDNAKLFREAELEKKRAESALQALREANEELRQANSDLEQFAYSASHDLQEPLRMVAIYSQMVKKKLGAELDAETNEYIGYIVEGALRMEHLIRDLLAYTQASEILEPPKTPADANKSLESAILNLRATIKEAEATVTYDPLPTLTAIHAVHLEQVFQNLIGNAIKYRSRDTPRVHVSAQRRTREWLFSVKDNGIGIDPLYKEQIFGIFKRLHTSAEFSGTGVGLAICQRIIERAGGRIWVESEPGQGAIFFFTIPEQGRRRSKEQG